MRGSGRLRELREKARGLESTVNMVAGVRAAKNAATQLSGSSPARSKKPEPSSLRLLSLNLHSGQPEAGWGDEENWFGPLDVPKRQEIATKVLEETLEILREIDPDILLLQEVDKGQRRSGYLPQGKFLAQGLGLKYWRLGAAYSGAFIGIHRRPLHSTIPNTSGYGLALASRFPVKSWHYKRLGRARPAFVWGGQPWQGTAMGLLAGLKSGLAALSTVKFRAEEQRVLLASRLNTPLGELAVGTTHLSTQVAAASAQTRRCWTSLAELNEKSFVLAGDFNLSPEQVREALIILGEDARPAFHETAPTFRALRPVHKIDQVLGVGWEPQSPARALKLPVSDHRALIVDIRPKI